MLKRCGEYILSGSGYNTDISLWRSQKISAKIKMCVTSYLAMLVLASVPRTWEEEAEGSYIWGWPQASFCGEPCLRSTRCSCLWHSILSQVTKIQELTQKQFLCRMTWHYPNVIWPWFLLRFCLYLFHISQDWGVKEGGMVPELSSRNAYAMLKGQACYIWVLKR